MKPEARYQGSHYEVCEGTGEDLMQPARKVVTFKCSGRAVGSLVLYAVESVISVPLVCPQIS